ncbi:DJ-1/PfpI family protein [Sinomonas sp. ASV486]|uniref:DJ-1/PfpI family protein n=1 Tax=Sinomonas sp. ASV486 TaxID=3051170 RepID=UPI0027DCDBBA|nr:DJ-1/PfpI family protein [Sinomonas sp. ASV486]MDQ4490527.1 DJ-1/PfpI family protein [Sinomonas sp. ASV486]
MDTRTDERTTAVPADPVSAPARVLVYLPEGMADWEVGYLMSALRQHDVTERAAELTTATATGQAVVSMGGLTVSPTAALADIVDERFDALVLCGGTSWYDDDDDDNNNNDDNNAAANREVLDLAGRCKATGALVAAICGAVDALGRAGLLDDVEHTGNDLGQLERWPGYRGSARFVREPHAVSGVTPSGGVLVTAGSWAPTDFAAAVLAELGALSATRAATWLRFWRDRDAAAIYELFVAEDSSAGGR